MSPLQKFLSTESFFSNSGSGETPDLNQTKKGKKSKAGREQGESQDTGLGIALWLQKLVSGMGARWARRAKYWAYLD